MKNSKTDNLPFTIRGVNLTKTSEIQNFSGEILNIFEDSFFDSDYNFADSVGYEEYVKIVNFDWVEFTAIKEEGQICEHNFLFDAEKCQYGSKYYSDMYNVSTIMYGDSVECFNLSVNPRPSFLDKNLVQVKLSNRMCYNSDIPELISNICKQFGLTFKNFTRLDLCIDHQRLNGYDNNIQQCFKDFMSGKLVMKAKSMETYSQRGWIQGMAWGSRQSMCRMVWYNKTKEMTEQTWKPWISDVWQKGGFDADLDVYRLEFSLKKPKNNTVVISEDSETFYDFADINLTSDIEMIIKYVAGKHLQVGDNSRGVEDFRNMKQINLISLEKSVFKQVDICLKDKSNNYTKSYIKRLGVDAMFYQRQGEIIQSSLIYSHIQTLVQRYQLQKWYDKTMYWLELKSSFTLFDAKNNELLKSCKLIQSDLPGINCN